MLLRHTHQFNPNFTKLAEAMGLKAIKAEKPEDLTPKIKELLDYNDGPILLEIVVDRKIPVLPMVPAGRALHDFIIYDAG